MHPDSRIAEMPVFDRMERGGRQGLAGFVAALPRGADGSPQLGGHAV
jgi:hypothetical protein